MFEGRTVSGGDWLGAENFLQFGVQKKGGRPSRGWGFRGRGLGFLGGAN